MSRSCDLTGKHVQYGNNVSHSKRHTRRRFEPNIQNVSLISEALGVPVSLRVSTRALRTVQKKGGLDAFLLNTADQKLPDTALKLKRRVRKRLTTPRKAAAAS